ALLLLLWFIPALVARSPLRNWMVRQVLASVEGRVRVGAASLGWFSPVVLYGVEISDGAGRPVVVVPQINSHRSLVLILAKSSDLGIFHCEQPVLQIFCSGQQSNVEQVFGSWLTAHDPPLTGPAVGIEVVNAKISIFDADTKQQWLLDPVDVLLAVPSDRSL